jgi:hypothetical protein
LGSHIVDRFLVDKHDVGADGEWNTRGDLAFEFLDLVVELQTLATRVRCARRRRKVLENDERRHCGNMLLFHDRQGRIAELGGMIDGGHDAVVHSIGPCFVDFHEVRALFVLFANRRDEFVGVIGIRGVRQHVLGWIEGDGVFSLGSGAGPLWLAT